MAQVAFELLAWNLFVSDRNALSADGIQRLPAVDQLRLLLSTARIPLSIPPTVKDLCAVAPGENWKDGPQSVTEIRNTIVHANPTKRKRIIKGRDNVLFDAWCLSLWYLELLLLWLCEYHGRYSNRLIRDAARPDEVETVP